MKRLVDLVCTADRERDISIYYTDRPSNDFSALFTLLEDPRNAESPVCSHGPNNVFLFACGNTICHEESREQREMS